MLQAALQTEPQPLSRQQCHDTLQACANGSTNSHWLAQIIASWQVGEGALPRGLGLSDQEFTELLACYFPGYALKPDPPSGIILDFSRMLEKHDLEKYLRHYSILPSPENEWLIALIVAACLGNDHLWQDLGLFSRSELSALLQYNFPRNGRQK